MARGMVVGEAIVSQAGTDEYRDGYARTFGDRKPQRGRWVWDEQAGRLVSAEDYVPPPAKTGTSVMCDRWMEGTRTADGEAVDIGSRAKRRAYMQARGLADASDFSDGWYAKVRADKQRENKKHRRAVLDRAIYEKFKP
jgi:hypothetical protein